MIIINLQECRIFADEKTPYPRTAPSEISFHKQKIYIANRGDNSISILNQNKDGTLSLFKTIPCKGENPRHFKIYTNASPNNRQKDISETFLFVLNQNSNTITIFEIDDNDIHYCNTFSDIEIYFHDGDHHNQSTHIFLLVIPLQIFS